MEQLFEKDKFNTPLRTESEFFHDTLFAADHIEPIRYFVDKGNGKVWWLAKDLVEALDYPCVGASVVNQEPGERCKMIVDGKRCLLLSDAALDNFLGKIKQEVDPEFLEGLKEERDVWIKSTYGHLVEEDEEPVAEEPVAENPGGYTITEGNIIPVEPGYTAALTIKTKGTIISMDLPNGQHLLLYTPEVTNAG